MYGDGLINETCYGIKNNVDTFCVSYLCNGCYIYDRISFLLLATAKFTASNLSTRWLKVLSSVATSVNYYVQNVHVIIFKQ